VTAAPGGAAPHFEALRRAIQARAGLVWLVTWEDSRARALVERLAGSALGAPVPCHVWSVTEGLRVEDKRIGEAPDLVSALRHAAGQTEPAVYLFQDVAPFLSDPVVRRALRDCFRASRELPVTVFLTGSRLTVPDDLLKEIQVVGLGLPTSAELDAVIGELTAGGELPAARRQALVNAVRGLTLDEARIALRTALLTGPLGSPESLAAAIEFKRQVTLKLGILEFVDNPIRESDVGGLETLKAWLAVRQRAFGAQALAHRLRPPKGMLVMGVPGCGKSLSIRLVAGMWELPLLRLDLANVYSGAFGTPEESLHRALTVAEAVAPVVLWIDEIEKGIAGIKSSDTGVAARVFGTFLTWMQEKTAPVFIGATANMIDLLPPEVLRKGRFDEVFFIDLPGAREREAIWQVHVQRHGIALKKYPPSELAKMTAHYNGAEIEQVVVNATLAAIAAGKEPTPPRSRNRRPEPGARSLSHS
jgi:hypothetical protein